MTGSIQNLMVAFAITGMGLSTATLANDAEKVRALSETRISLTQAIAAAEKYQGGQAYEASIDDDSFKPEYEISMVKNGKTYEVTVDGVSGEVIRIREDH